MDKTGLLSAAVMNFLVSWQFSSVRLGADIISRSGVIVVSKTINLRFMETWNLNKWLETGE